MARFGFITGWCGYSCNRECGLDIMECMKTHYKRDCGHVWDGPMKEEGNAQSVTCSKCGMWALSHDMACGP